MNGQEGVPRTKLMKTFAMHKWESFFFIAHNVAHGRNAVSNFFPGAIVRPRRSRSKPLSPIQLNEVKIDFQSASALKWAKIESFLNLKPVSGGLKLVNFIELPHTCFFFERPPFYRKFRFSCIKVGFFLRQVSHRKAERK